MARRCTGPKSRDIDLYQFVVTEAGLFRAETIAERLPTSSLLNTVLTLYQETSIPGQPVTRQIIARNDDYYGNDSYLEVCSSDAAGTYYVGVTSVGNIEVRSHYCRQRLWRPHARGLQPEAGDQARRRLDAWSIPAGVRFDGDADNRAGRHVRVLVPVEHAGQHDLRR